MASATLTSILFLLLAAQHSSGEISQEAIELSQQWAPLIWLQNDEVFFPSTVDFYIRELQVRDEDEEVVQEDPTASTIVSGPGTEDLHLNTIEDIKCVNCFEDFFFGQPPSEFGPAPVYTHIREYGDECNTIDVSYKVFYPYNYGKDVCIGVPQDDGDCVGYQSAFGNHMDDWEGATIRFRDGMPTDLYLGAHTFGAWYVYNESTSTFTYRDGEQMIEILDNDKDLGEDLADQLRIVYPQEVVLVEGTHPEVFSANGSHGTWGAEGQWWYFDLLFVQLYEICDRGEAIRTWENPVYIDRNIDESEFDGTDLQWVNFQGKFGNQQRLNCEFEFIAGECGLEDSGGQPGIPSGPSDAFEACEEARGRR